MSVFTRSFRTALILLALAAQAQALNVRVLVTTAPQVTVRVPQADGAPSGSPLNAASARPAAPALPTAAWTVGLAQNRLTLNGQDAGTASLYLPPSAGSVVEIAGKAYRGGVLLRAEKGQVQGINVVDVEDYLRGVVASEMPSSWPAAALAAQAVIARTYVAANVNPAAAYDICATESCQVYGGLSAERATTDAAIQATRAQVVAYGGRPARTYFSSDSGGFTASSGEVWGNDFPYLVAKPDPFSVTAGSPRAKWRLDVPLAKVQEVAARYVPRIGRVRGVSISKVSASGRPLEVTLTGDQVTRITGANAGGFIRSLGAGSTRVSLSGINPLVMEGYGLGHGVGLSQYGALGLAQQRYDHLHILGFYYPGTSLSTLAGSGPAGAVLADTGLEPLALDQLALGQLSLRRTGISAGTSTEITSTEISRGGLGE